MKVQRLTTKNKLHKQCKEKIMDKITKKSRNLALAMCLGDGSINKNSPYLAIRHCKKQLEYLEWKRKLLKHYGFSCSDIYYVENNGYGAYEFRTSSCNSLISVRNCLYKNNIKTFSLKALKKIDELGLAIWYLDDGSISTTQKKSVLTISTCISKEENQIIIDFIYNRFGVKFGQRKMRNHYSLICGTKEARKFIKIVEPYINEIKCMKYKLNVKPLSNRVA